jgi:hypothetical protein
MATKGSKGAKKGGGTKGTKGGKRPGGSKKGTPGTTPTAAHDLFKMFRKCVDKCFADMQACFQSGTKISVCADRAQACVNRCFRILQGHKKPF